MLTFSSAGSDTSGHPSQLDTSPPKRAGYTVVWSLSLFRGRHLNLTTLLERDTLVLLETTPGVISWEETGLNIPFEYRRETCLACLPFAVANQRNRQLWQILESSKGEQARIAMEVGQRHCLETGFEHVTAIGIELQARALEMRNRHAAHKLLFSARERATKDLESRAVVHLRRQPLKVNQLAAALQLRPSETRLVVLRAWLNQLVTWPINEVPLMSDFVAEANDV